MEYLQRRKAEGVPDKHYWCCKADFGQHESTCPNFVPVAPTPCGHERLDENGAWRCSRESVAPTPAIDERAVIQFVVEDIFEGETRGYKAAYVERLSKEWQARASVAKEKK